MNCEKLQYRQLRPVYKEDMDSCTTSNGMATLHGIMTDAIGNNRSRYLVPISNQCEHLHMVLSFLFGPCTIPDPVLGSVTKP